MLTGALLQFIRKSQGQSRWERDPPQTQFPVAVLQRTSPMPAASEVPPPGGRAGVARSGHYHLAACHCSARAGCRAGYDPA